MAQLFVNNLGQPQPDKFYFLRSVTNPDGIGSLHNPFKIAFGSPGDLQKEVLCDGIRAMYAFLGLMEPECLETLSVNIGSSANIYEIVSDLYGNAVKSIEDSFDGLFFGLTDVIGLNDPDIKIELFESFRFVYEGFEETRYRNLISAAKILNQHALSSSGEDTIDDFLELTGIIVKPNWATLSELSGYTISSTYIQVV